MTPEDFAALPEVTEVSLELALLSNMASKYAIDGPDAFAQAGEHLQRVKGVAKRLEAGRDRYVRPLNQEVKNINNLFASLGDRLAGIERTIKRAMAAWADAERARLADQQRHLDEEARKQREKLAMQAAKAEAAGKTEKAEDLQLRAATTVAPVVPREPPKVAGVSMRAVWKYEITNPAIVPREMCSPDPKKIAAIVAALKSETNIPGVRVYEDQQVAARSA
jgi:hypothetical protein